MSRTILSPCRTYRYVLWREWFGGKGYIVFIGLNPSTADEKQNDATIRRCIAYSKLWGYSAVCMLNLFAYRATKPEIMRAASDPIGPENDKYIKEYIKDSEMVIACWGTGGSFLGRDEEVKKLIYPHHYLKLNKLRYLKLTKDGHPNHPLYLPKDITPTEWKLNGCDIQVR